MTATSVSADSSGAQQPEDVKGRIAPLLGRVPSGVFILVVGSSDGQQTGMLASWVQQASFEPPQVTVAVNRSRYINDWMQPGTLVTLNQVVKGDNTLFRQFGKGFEPGVDAFAGVETEVGTTGLPVLTAALGSLEGRVSKSMEAGDHVIYLVDILDARGFRDILSTEVFVHLRKNGFSY